MLQYGIAGAIQIPWYAASRFLGSSSIASVGTHSKGSRTWSSASFVKRWVGFLGLKSPTTPIKALMSRDILAPAPGERAQARRRLLLADRLHAEAGPRAREGRHDADGRRRQREREIVAVGEAVGADRRRRQRRDLGQHVADGDTQDFAERERADGEVGASETEGDRADEQRERGRGQRAQPRPREHRPLGDPERARDEGAEAEERRVAEVDLAGVAGDDVPRLGERHREEHEEEEVQHVVAPDDEWHRRQGGQRRHAEREPPATAHRAKSPRGRATSTARKMTRPTTSRYGPPNANALAASARPRTRPPTKVPSIEPSPARTTTMSAFSVHSSPMDGLIE